MGSPHRLSDEITHEDSNSRHPLDPWIDEVGEDYFVELAESTRRGVAEDTIPTFSDMGMLLDHVNSRIAGQQPE